MKHRKVIAWRGVAGAVGLLLVAGFAGAALAQDKPLQESQVTEKGLIEALAPQPDDAAAEGQAAGQTRGFKLNQPAGARRQSVLMTFASDSAELSAGTMKMLDVLALALQSEKLLGLHVDIEGHADPRGGEAHNLSLSTARAQSVINYLVDRHRIARERLLAVGKGATELANKSNPTAPENRRVVIVSRPM